MAGWKLYGNQLEVMTDVAHQYWHMPMPNLWLFVYKEIECQTLYKCWEEYIIGFYCDEILFSVDIRFACVLVGWL